MCVYKFLDENSQYVELVEGNFKNAGTITLYKDGELKYYSVENNRIIGLKN